MSPSRPYRVAFLYINGAHQILHSAPAAAELSRDPDFSVDCLVTDYAEREMVQRVADAWPQAALTIRQLALPGRRFSRHQQTAPKKKPKRAYLVANICSLMRYDAIVVVERILTLPRRFGVGPRMIHVPHGAGDGAYGFSRRVGYFDYVIVSGQKDADRMIGEKLVAPEKCAVSGSVKLGGLAHMNRPPARLFDNARPTVLYNPHFNPSLSSWPDWGMKVIESFAAQEDFNLVVAPHVQMLRHADENTKKQIAAHAIAGKILIDTGSPRCIDMSYTAAADIYLGDVSSQIYEFQSRPRPCVFLNAHNTLWHNDPNYAGWQMGEVVSNPQDILAAVRRAPHIHPNYLVCQQQAVARALGSGWNDAPARMAGLIRDYLRRQTP